jgi:putative transposase
VASSQFPGDLIASHRESADHGPWSSVYAHLAEEDDAVVSVAPMLRRVSDWARYLSEDSNESELERIQPHGRSGRPAGDDCFINQLQLLTGKVLIRRKPGPKRLNE